jgi:hypothetical protein
MGPAPATAMPAMAASLARPRLARLKALLLMERELEIRLLEAVTAREQSRRTEQLVTVRLVLAMALARAIKDRRFPTSSSSTES